SIQNLGHLSATVTRVAGMKAEDHLGAFPRKVRLLAGRLLQAGMNRGANGAGKGFGAWCVGEDGARGAQRRMS
ncbi:MAG: hypothetical protein NTV59_01125, partial [Chloroflexi bacterium]|nr:hypothetical protein [Chloroflexota bacterium]